MKNRLCQTRFSYQGKRLRRRPGHTSTRLRSVDTLSGMKLFVGCVWEAFCIENSAVIISARVTIGTDDYMAGIAVAQMNE